jgi:ferredoxin--NADP+ reductase
MPDTALNAVVTQRIEVSSGLIILHVAPDGWELPPFTPGQFAVLGLPGSAPRCEVADPDGEAAPAADKLIKRAYSISSASTRNDSLEFYITLVYSGALTPRLFALQPGDRLWLGPKIAGLFTLEQLSDERDVLMIATGTGLAPYMSMIRTRLMRDRERCFTVVHGARHSWDLGYRSELTTLEEFCERFTYIPVISRPTEEHLPWKGAAGYAQDCWANGLIARRQGAEPDPAHTDLLLCGNPSMIEAVVAVAEQRGWRKGSRQEPGTIHVEEYW